MTQLREELLTAARRCWFDAWAASKGKVEVQEHWSDVAVVPMISMPSEKLW
jgi:hypothetical protein